MVTGLNGPQFPTKVGGRRVVKVLQLEGDGTIMGPKHIVWEWEGSQARFEEIRDTPSPEESLSGDDLRCRNIIDGPWHTYVVTETDS